MNANGNSRGVGMAPEPGPGDPAAPLDVLPPYDPAMTHRGNGAPIYGERCFWALLGAAAATALILYMLKPGRD